MNSIILSIAEAQYGLFGYTFSVAFPLALLGIITFWQVKKFSFDLPIVCALFALLPAFTPFLAEIFGYRYFTMLNYALQEDPVLEIAAVQLISLFCASFIAGSWLRNRSPKLKKRSRLIFSLPLTGALVVVCLVLILIFLETGTIVFQSYGELKLNTTAEYSSLVNQIFNLTAAILLCNTLGKSRRRLLAVIYAIMIITLLLLSRRTLAMSLMILSVYTFGLRKLSAKQIIGLVLSVSLLVFIGEARRVGLVNFLQGVEQTGARDLFFALPGGASNVFVGTMGVIHMHANDLLSFPDTTPVLQWINGTYEATIYSRLTYDYNGGMHLANVLFWNFGLLGVILFGVLLGWITRRVHNVASQIDGEYRGTLPAILSFAFILTVPNLLWYHPIGTINLIIAVTLVSVVLIFAKRKVQKRQRFETGQIPHARR
jgi:hypothetical protein